MSMCTVCHKDNTKHDEELCKLHQQKLVCIFCGKSSKKHSVKLWKIHASQVPKGEKIGSMQIGFGPRVPAKIKKWNAVSQYNVEYIPIYMYCRCCNLALGRIEEECKTELGEHCIGCFKNITEQTENGPFGGFLSRNGACNEEKSIASHDPIKIQQCKPQFGDKK